MSLVRRLSGLFRKKESGAEGNRSTTLAASGAGILLVLLILLIFILAATWLKAVFAGVLCAYLFLPLERFFERLVQSRAARAIARFVVIPFLPLIKLKHTLMHKKEPVRMARQEQLKKMIDTRTTWASGLTVLSLLVTVVLLIFCIIRFLFPFAVDQGSKMLAWAKEKEAAAEQVTVMEQQGSRDEIAGLFLDFSRKFISQKSMEQLSTQAEDLMRANAFTLIVKFLSVVGSFLVDLLMFIFFFFFFLQKMAAYRARVRETHGSVADDIGSWTVRGILKSGWLPAFSDTAREHAEDILKRIIRMFDAWLRGYVVIILVETLLYTTIFLLVGVPYAIPLGVFAGLTILLPFLGPLISMLLTTAAVLAFSSGSFMLPLVGVVIAYSMINGILEQFFLYPTLVGEAIGLTTLETIITVLAGAALAGIPGMIFAVPAAALLKFLVPMVYRIQQQQNTKEASEISGNA